VILIGDTSGLVAAFNTDDPEHEKARGAFRAASATVISPLVVAEIEHVLTRNVDRRVAHAVQDWLLEQEQTMRVLVPEVAADVLRRARSVQDRYADLRLDLADGVNVVLAAQYESWLLPAIIMLGVPVAILGALGAQWLRGFSNDVFCQIGLVLLVLIVIPAALFVALTLIRALAEIGRYAEDIRTNGTRLADAVGQAAPLAPPVNRAPPPAGPAAAPRSGSLQRERQP
jgi:predicted nucleic acid-binding protein